MSYLILDSILAVGSFNPSNVKTELYNSVTGSWTTMDDYPFFIGSTVNGHDMVYIPATSAFYVIGGDDINRGASQMPCHICLLSNVTPCKSQACHPFIRLHPKSSSLINKFHTRQKCIVSHSLVHTCCCRVHVGGVSSRLSDVPGRGARGGGRAQHRQTLFIEGAKAEAAAFAASLPS